jgi:hypothetical protein
MVSYQQNNGAGRGAAKPYVLNREKRAVSWLFGAARVAGFPMSANAIDVALRSIDLAEGMRTGQDDAVKQALRRCGWK